MLISLRIVSGIVLFVFVLAHLIAIAFGVHSIDAMEQARRILMAPWSNPIGGSILVLSFLVHGLLGLWSLFKRNTLRMSGGDGVQALLGLAILPLLLPHALGAILMPILTDGQPDFKFVLAAFWLFAPMLGIQQVVTLIVVWIHGCYGLFLWMQVQDWWGRWSGWTYPFVVIVPVMALLGFVEAGKPMVLNSGDPEFMASVRESAEEFSKIASTVNSLHNQIMWGYAFLVVLTFAARWLRLNRGQPMTQLKFVGGPLIPHRAGLSLLETGQLAHVPNVALCGARGRCGSCAVRVLDGGDNLSPVGSTESATLERTSADSDMRLACQARLERGRADVEVFYPPVMTPQEYQELLRERRAERAAGRLPGLPAEATP